MATQPNIQSEDLVLARRKLIVHDSVAFLSLLLVTVVLFAVTLFLFRSFSAHRADLALRWSERGTEALHANKPEEAIVALRTALSYAPGTRAYELLLAQALGEAGLTDESTNYFMGLWEAQPGNGFINLQLARLAAKRNDRQAAVNFYRAAIYGTWEGDAIARRTAGRIELARYLLANRDAAPARMELLIAGSNSPDSPDLDFTLATLLAQAEDAPDAQTYYARTLASRPRDLAALTASARLAFQSGDYETARRLFTRAQSVEPLTDSDAALLDQATSILQPPSPPPTHHRKR